VSLIVTVCVPEYVAPAGLNVGVATCDAMVYVALAVALVVIPEAVAKALIVSVELTVSGPLYCFVDPLTEVPG
jgi:hypothetical protein